MSIAFIMTNSRQSSTSTDDGGTHQSDDHSGSDTDPGSPHPFHPTTSILRLPESSKAATTGSGNEAIYLGSSEVPEQYHVPLSGTPPDDDVTMNEEHLEKHMKEISKGEKGKRRAAGNAPWDDQSETDDERRKDVPETSSAVSRTQGRMSRTATTPSSGVSKKPRSGPVRRKTNEEPGMSRGFSKRAGTRPGLRSQSKAQSQAAGTSVRDEETEGGLAGGVEDMSINDHGS